MCTHRLEARRRLGGGEVEAEAEASSGILRQARGVRRVLRCRGSLGLGSAFPYTGTAGFRTGTGAAAFAKPFVV